METNELRSVLQNVSFTTNHDFKQTMYTLIDMTYFLTHFHFSWSVQEKIDFFHDLLRMKNGIFFVELLFENTEHRRDFKRLLADPLILNVYRQAKRKEKRSIKNARLPLSS